MTLISIDVDRHDYDTLMDLLKRDRGSNHSVLLYREMCLVEDIAKEMDRGLPKPKMDEPTENYTVIRGEVGGKMYRFVRDGSAPGQFAWLCFDNHKRYAWSQINNPEVIK